MADQAYDDAPTAEEIAAAEAEDRGQPVATPAPAPEAAPAPAADPAPGPTPEQAEDQRFQQWREQNKDKSPDDLARLAFQQQSRADRAGYDLRRSKEEGEARSRKVNEALQTIAQRREALKTRDQTFQDKLKNDPDAATRDLHDALRQTEEERLAGEETQVRREAAVSLAMQVFPDLPQVAPDMQAFGRDMGYSDAELNGITDARDLLTLRLAHMSANLMKRGIMNAQGQVLIQQPQPVAATDPRLAAPAPVRTLGSSAGRAQGSGKTLDQQLEDLARMSDADLAKMDPKVVENLLRQAG